jgi:hypothetical protein
MWRALATIILGGALCVAGIVPAGADDQKAEIKGGIEGKVKSVDVEGQKLTIITSQGRERTFTINEDTTMVGPRGGKVRRHLKDPRFHEGFPVTIVADGNAAEQVHFGFAKDATGAEHADAGKPATRTEAKNDTVDRPKTSKNTSTPPADAASTARNVARHKEAKKLEDEDDEEELPGHIKSFNASRRLLVVTLLNGKQRSFLLAKEVPVHISGAAKASTEGLEDPELKAGAGVTVVTDESGRKVKELKITPASQLKRKKAG